MWRERERERERERDRDRDRDRERIDIIVLKRSAFCVFSLTVAAVDLCMPFIKLRTCFPFSLIPGQRPSTSARGIFEVAMFMKTLDSLRKLHNDSVA